MLTFCDEFCDVGCDPDHGGGTRPPWVVWSLLGILLQL